MADPTTSKHPAPSQRRYPPELRERAVRMVLELRRQDPADHTVISRVARQLGVGAESLRTWVKNDEAGAAPRAVKTEQDVEVAALRRENRELKRANEILLAASSFFGAELDRRQPK
jgi:transposase